MPIAFAQGASVGVHFFWLVLPICLKETDRYFGPWQFHNRQTAITKKAWDFKKNALHIAAEGIFTVKNVLNIGTKVKNILRKC